MTLHAERQIKRKWEKKQLNILGCNQLIIQNLHDCLLLPSSQIQILLPIGPLWGTAPSAASGGGGGAPLAIKRQAKDGANQAAPLIIHKPVGWRRLFTSWQWRKRHTDIIDTSHMNQFKWGMLFLRLLTLAGLTALVAFAEKQKIWAAQKQAKSKCTSRRPPVLF